MLSSGFQRVVRTAAGLRRRPCLCLLLVLPALGGCSGVEPGRPTERRLAEKVAGLVERHEPSAARSLRALIREAGEVESEVRQTPFWRRRGGRVDAAWGRVMARAAETHREIRAARRAAIRDWGNLEVELQEAVERARSEMAEPGLGRPEAFLLAQAETRAGEARRLAGEGRFAEAVRAAERALESTASIHREYQEVHARFGDSGEVAVWRRWVEESMRQASLEGQRLIVVDKLRRRVEVFSAGRLEASFSAELGTNGLARKLHAGDRATPEGRYRVVSLKGSGATRYHRALLLDYPNADDRRRWVGAVRQGALSGDRGPGSLIEIHGEGGRGRDWTDGCVALTNPDMERLFAMAELGTPVTIVGTWSRWEVSR